MAPLVKQLTLDFNSDHDFRVVRSRVVKWSLLKILPLPLPLPSTLALSKKKFKNKIIKMSMLLSGGFFLHRFDFLFYFSLCYLARVGMGDHTASAYCLHCLS